ncbi:hypothetical protein NIES4101_51650 [Calothrix sp. NIES-4101]|nr:hypothetical protein NIES4101_51650 [Calothrix sp. NIES-4101]
MMAMSSNSQVFVKLSISILTAKTKEWTLSPPFTKMIFKFTYLAAESCVNMA